jgi:hypothetical protein
MIDDSPGLVYSFPVPITDDPPSPSTPDPIAGMPTPSLDPVGDSEPDEMHSRLDCFLLTMRLTLSRSSFHDVWPDAGGHWTWTLDELIVFLKEVILDWVLLHEFKWHSCEDPRKGRARRQVAWHHRSDRRQIVPVSIPAKCTGIAVRPTDIFFHLSRWKAERSVDENSKTHVYSALEEKIAQPYSRCTLHGLPILPPAHGHQYSVCRPVAKLIDHLHMKKSLPISVFKRAYVDQLYQAIFPNVAPTADQATFCRYGGYLNLQVQSLYRSDKLDRYRDPHIDRIYAIVRGCSAHRRAASILRNREENRISAILMDTTWSMMQRYITVR